MLSVPPPMSPATSELDAFVTSAAAGDREAFARLVEATSGLVASITLAILRDLELSRDVAQDVFLSAWTNLHQLRNPASFLPWLRQTARHRAHDVLRRRLRRRRTVEEGQDDDVLAAAADPRADASAALLDAEQ